MKLRVWWIPQVPMKPFHAEVPTLAEGKRTLTILGKYDLFQLANNIKPDFSNAGGLQVFEDGEWLDWENEDGYGIDDLTLEEAEALDRAEVGVRATTRKGRWTVKGLRSLSGTDGREVRFYGDGIVLALSSPSDEERSNYKLMVCAPEMSEALLEIRDHLYNRQDWDRARDMASSVLKKAGVIE